MHWETHRGSVDHPNLWRASSHCSVVQVQTDSLSLCCQPFFAPLIISSTKGEHQHYFTLHQREGTIPTRVPFMTNQMEVLIWNQFLLFSSVIKSLVHLDKNSNLRISHSNRPATMAVNLSYLMLIQLTQIPHHTPTAIKTIHQMHYR